MRNWWSVYAAMPANIWVLFFTLALVMTAVPLMVLVSGLIGAELAPTPNLATLPLACVVIGTALMTLPAAFVVRLKGRRFGGFLGIACAFAGALAGVASTELASFGFLLLGSVLMGVGMAFFQQFRFAAIESLRNPADAGPAVSLIMFSGIVSALIGPELGVWGLQWPGFANYSGSFVILAGLVLTAAVVYSRFSNPLVTQGDDGGSVRPLREIVCQPVFLVAVAAAAIGYGVMSFLMTSTPISMHVLHGHALGEAKWVIQSHLLAMFMPSLFSGVLLRLFGAGKLMLAGCALYLTVLLIATAGHEVIHYWWALVLLGIGWNFLFLAGTTLLPAAYRGAERFKTQAVNDFAVFAIQAAASLSAGWVLYRFGWTVQVWSCLVPVLALLLVSAFYGWSRSGRSA